MMTMRKVVSAVRVEYRRRPFIRMEVTRHFELPPTRHTTVNPPLHPRRAVSVATLGKEASQQPRTLLGKDV